jgi:hypothetical protein
MYLRKIVWENEDWVKPAQDREEQRVVVYKVTIILVP